MLAVESFQFNLTTLLKVDARTGNKVVHHIGHQDFAAQGLARDARRVVNGRRGWLAEMGKTPSSCR